MDACHQSLVHPVILEVQYGYSTPYLGPTVLSKGIEYRARSTRVILWSGVQYTLDRTVHDPDCIRRRAEKAPVTSPSFCSRGQWGLVPFYCVSGSISRGNCDCNNWHLRSTAIVIGSTHLEAIPPTSEKMDEPHMLLIVPSRDPMLTFFSLSSLGHLVAYLYLDNSPSL